VRRADAGPAELSLGGWKPIKAGERATVTVDLRNADGILGLDLALTYAPSRIAIVNVQAAAIGSGLSLARADREGTTRIRGVRHRAAVGLGQVLAITIEALRNAGGNDEPSIAGMANEGAIPLRVRGRIEPPSPRK